MRRLRAHASVSVVLGLAFAALHCASPPPEPCGAGARDVPAIDLACRSEPGTRRYVEEAASHLETALGSRFGSAEPGALHLELAFDENSRIESVCVREQRGALVSARATEAASRLARLGRAPDCFAKRRIEIAWESAVVTPAELDRALAACRANARSRSSHPFCAAGCTLPDLLRLSGGDEAVLSCLLDRLPFVVGDTFEAAPLTFLPRAGERPGVVGAFDAEAECAELDARSERVACMAAHGWEVVDWNARRSALFD